jgi:hypothetical protein
LAGEEMKKKAAATGTAAATKRTANWQTTRIMLGFLEPRMG